jgi:O-acetyl-ADP-ribose deacetylase (regulator of RNase III)
MKNHLSHTIGRILSIIDKGELMSYISTQTVSADNTPANASLQSLNMVPLGASVWTSSGNLADSNITAIAQAASGAMGHFGVGFDPTRDSIAACIENSFLLASRQGYTSLAVPFIASGIFIHRILPAIDKDELASLIVQSCQSYRGSVDAVIVAYGASDMSDFENAMQNNTDEGVTLVEGSITDYADHKCAAIVNAANMEVIFGGGISGRIGAATGEIQQIDAEAAIMIQGFWKANS